MSRQDAQSRNPIEILYEDDRFVVFNKPPGLLVIPSPKNEQRTLVSLVNRQFAHKEGEFHLHPCHRLDRDTSGAILFAKGKKNQQLMMDLFHHGKIRKLYIAFVNGKLKSREGEFRGRVRDLDQKRFQKNAPAKSAQTRYKVVQTKRSFSVVEVQPVTGRTNQIRIHFAEAGHPLVGERKYAFARDYDIKFKRVALHAAFLEWPDPVSHEVKNVSVPLPEDMQTFKDRHG